MCPEISVIMPTYNRANYLSSAIRSVLDQTYQDFEIIVVDDASTDNTGQIVSKFDDKRVGYIRHDENRGGSAARNTGIKLSKGKYIAFLDDDDLWLPKKLEKQLDVINDGLEIGVVYSGAWKINETGKIIGYRIPSMRGNIFPDILKKNYIGSCSLVMTKRECIDKVGLFDEDLLASQDWDLWIRLAKQYRVQYNKEPLVLYRVHEKRITANPYAKMQASKLMLNKFSRELNMVDGHRKIRGTWHYRFGSIYCNLGDTRKGKKEFTMAIRNDPLSINYHFRLLACFFGSKIYNVLRGLLESLLPTSFKPEIS